MSFAGKPGLLRRLWRFMVGPMESLKPDPVESILKRVLSPIDRQLSGFNDRLKAIEGLVNEAAQAKASQAPDINKNIPLPPVDAPEAPVVEPGNSPQIKSLMDLGEKLICFLNAYGPDFDALIVSRRFGDLLKVFDLRLLGERGETFDPRLHEASYLDEDPQKFPDTILEVIQPGFADSYQVLRKAMVVVNRPKSSEATRSDNILRMQEPGVFGFMPTESIVLEDSSDPLGAQPIQDEAIEATEVAEATESSEAFEASEATDATDASEAADAQVLELSPGEERA
ncbi:MAG: nucleotide exchange factor GrpE [Deltaproteobacteria bacterium]|jgi:hypothetical protein|nr:nucleotide exchange factor GrpE [Deltaproteobacteria bacterium]